MDELMEQLKKRKIRIEINGELIVVMAFTDNLVLLTEDHVT